MTTARDGMLFAGASAIALLSAPLYPNAARASSLNALVSSAVANRTGGSSSGLSSAQGLSQQAAAAAATTKQSLQDMLAATAAISAQASAQAAARLTAAGTEPAVPNGLNMNLAVNQGLTPATNLDTTLTTTSAGVVDSGSGVVWYGASAPVQTQSGNQYTVTITQTSAKAILTWTNFDIGQNTTLVFVQTQNGAANGAPERDWIALNRVTGGSVRPSEILGKIQADGQVYVINQNGVIFGGTSQINVNSLVASTLDIDNPLSPGSLTTLAARNTQFLSAGADIYGQLALGAPLGSNGNGAPTYEAGNVSVQAGAQIETPALSVSDTYLGRVLLAAPNVSNAGTISAPDGQVALISAVQLQAYANDASAVSASNGNLSGVDPDLRGIQVVYPSSVNVFGTRSYTDPTAPATSVVTDSGLIEAPRGNITIEGNDIVLAPAGNGLPAGVLEATTSVKENGSIYLTPEDVGIPSVGAFTAGNLTFGAGSVVAILPDTALNADGAVPTIPESSITEAGYLPSIIKISLPSAYVVVSQPSGGGVAAATGAVTMNAGSLIEAPAATVEFLSTSQSIPPALATITPNLVIDSGAAIDVAGLAGIQESVADDIINVSRVGLNELANSPLQRTGPIYQANVNIDVRLGTPLFDASGYIDDYSLTAQQLAANGGSVAIGVVDGAVAGGSYSTTGNGIVSAVTAFNQGAVINVMGGYTVYQAGYLNTTKLLTANGDAIVDIGQASPNVLYAGIAGSYSVDHPRWGVTTTYNDLLFINGSGSYDPGYVQGANAGSVTFGGFAELGGTIDAPAVQGTYQRAGSGIYATSPPTRGAVDVTAVDIATLDIQSQTPVIAPIDGAVAFDTLLNQTIGAGLISGAGAGAFKIAATDSIAIDPGASIALAPGSGLSLAAASIAIGAGAGIIDPSGSITLSLNNFIPASSVSAPSQFLSIGNGAVLSVAGNWINDTGADVFTLVGSDYVNGGAISIVSTQTDGGDIPIDRISIGAGAVIDLDGGGYVTSAGKLAYGGNGLPLGKGGSLTMALHQTDALFNANGVNIVVPVVGGAEQIDDSVTIDPTATVSAYGLAGGGAFTLQGPHITVSAAGDATLPTTVGATGQFDVSTGFLENAGFGSYSLIAELTGQITAGTEVDLRLLQYLPTANASSATTLAQAVTLGANAGVLRPATNFSFSGLGWVDGLMAYDDPANQANVINGSTEYGAAAGFGTQIAQNALVIGQGATIDAGPGATVMLSASGSLTFDGAISAPGGTIALSQVNDYARYSVNTNDVVDYFGTLTLGPNAVLNAAGAMVTDPRQQLYVTGEVLAGGAVTLSATEITGETGSRIDVAGASGTLDLPYAVGLNTVTEQAQTVMSSGGEIAFTGAVDPTVSGEGLVYGDVDTAFDAAGGGGGSAAGTLSITSNYLSIVAKYGAPRVAADQATVNDQGVKGANADTVSGPRISAARIDAGDFDVIDFQVATETQMTGDNTLGIENAVRLTAGRLIDVTGYDAKLGSHDGVATFSAPYVDWTGDAVLHLPAIFGPGDGTLNIEASDTLEFAGSISFRSIGNLNLSAPQIAFVPDTSSTAGGTVYSGRLVAGGNVTLDAGAVYPSTGTSFLIEAVYPTSTITFANSASLAGVAPLSVGGTLSVEATNIVVGSGATIAAPYGQINLGTMTPVTVDDSTFETANVTLASGSTVTVSGAGQLLPYGETQDLQTWLYGQLGAISAPPAKAITIDAASANVAKGATVDLSGGGDISAYEYVPGLGGETNVLSAAPTNGFAVTGQGTLTFSGQAIADAPAIITVKLPNGSSVTYATQNSDTPATLASRVAALVTAEGVKATVNGDSVTASGGGLSATVEGYTGTVYAILPGLTAKSAPVDVYGYADPLNVADPAIDSIGRALTLSEPADGLAAGSYLLLPVTYADLPGALRVEVMPTEKALPGNAAETGLDGTVTIAATLGYAGTDGVANGSRASENVAVGLQTAAVWNRYSQINVTTGNQYFAALATSSGDYVPQLPRDAGQLSIDITGANSNLALNGTLDFSVGSGGRGGQLFIAAPAIEVVSDDQTADSDVLALSPSEIAGFGAPRVTLGATGQVGATGETLDVTASSIVVETDSTDPLVIPEITLAATAAITVDAGSVIEAAGTVTAASGGTIAIAGDGALVRVSAAGAATIARTDVGNVTGTIAFGGGVVIDGDSSIGGAAAVEIDGTSTVSIPVSSSITASAIDVSGQMVTFTRGTATTGGVQFNNLGTLGEATTVTIQASQQIAFDTAVDLSAPANGSGLQDLTLDTPALVFASGAGGDVSITAATLTLTNSAGPNTATTPPSGLSTAASGTLSLSADTLDLTGASRVVYGFDHVTATASKEVLTGAGAATGTLLLQGSDLAVTTPVIVAANGSYQIVQANGAIALSAPSSGAAAPVTGQVGGRVAFDGLSITVATDISAISGEIDLRARGAGGIEVTGGGSLNAQGYAQQYLATASGGTETVLPGGIIALEADAGNIALDSGSVISVAAAVGGNAGTVSLTLGSPGSVLTVATPISGQNGGGATSGGSFALDTLGSVDLTALLPVLAGGGFTDSVSVESGVGDLVVGQTLTAQQVLLSADDSAGTGGGHVVIDANIDASGNAANGEGGTVQIYGTSGVTLAAGMSIAAVATDPTQRGGQVTIGVGVDASGESGILNLAAGSTIDVSGDGRSYGSDAGMIVFRTPFVNADGATAWTGGAGASQIAAGAVLASTLVGAGATAMGAPNVILEPYQRIDVTALYSTAGGVTTIDDWTPIFNRFAPNTTPLGAQYAGYQVMPGLELDDATGSIAITANLDLAATTTEVVTTSGGTPAVVLVPTYRYGSTTTTATTTITGQDSAANGVYSQTLQTADLPGILTVRAAGDIDLEATISDGFTFTPSKTVTSGSDLGAAADLEQAVGPTETGTNIVTITKKNGTKITQTEKLSTVETNNPLLESWSYQFVAGARFTGGIVGNPISTAQATTFQAGGTLANQGNFIMGSAPTLANGGDLGLAAVLLRTGTGSIGIYAGGQGLGAAGVGAIIANLDAQNALNFTYDQAAGFHIDADASVLLLNPSAAIYSAGYDAIDATAYVIGMSTAPADGFDGIFTAYSPGQAGKLYKANKNNVSYLINPALTGANWNDPAFATMGGDITVSAPHGSIVAQQHFHDILLNASGGVDATGATASTDTVLLTDATNPAAKVAGVTSDLGQTPNWWLNGQIVDNQTGAADPAVWVETGMFQQGVAALGGGDVAIDAGLDVRDVSVSIVSTYYVNTNLSTPAVVNNGYGYGGGNLTIAAGGNIASIVTQVEQGNTTVNAGGSIVSNYSNPEANDAGVGLVAATQPIGSSFTWSAGSVTVLARGAIDQIAAPWEGDAGAGGVTFTEPGGITGLSFENANLISQRSGISLESPGQAPRLTIVAEGGDLNFAPDAAGDDTLYTVTPPTVTLASISGSVTIAGGLLIQPSSTGNLDVLAMDSIAYWTGSSGSGGAIQFIDVDPSMLQSPTNVFGLPAGAVAANSADNGIGYLLNYTATYSGSSTSPLYGQTNYTLNDPSILHQGDTQPFRMIALDGSIETGIDPTGAVDTSAVIHTSQNAGVDFEPEPIYANKPAVISAGLDLLNMSFAGENNAASDTTTIQAGRDITYTNYSTLTANDTVVSSPAGSNFIIGGPGTFDLIAGRDINLQPSQSIDSPPLAATAAAGSGAQAVGNGINPWLPQESAQINILYGVSPGIDNTGFIAAYLAPATAGAFAATYDPLLQGYVQSLDGSSTPPSAANALAIFDNLTVETQLPFLEQVLFDEIRNVANPSSPSYNDFTRAYAAVNALFPASYGYSNDLTTKHTVVSTGDLNMTNSVVDTIYTSDINILGPGGGATVGGLSALGATGNVIPVDQQGVLAVQGGAINALIDDDFNVFSSRVLALDGGALTIASINGSIDAGRGAKTVSLVPPLTVSYTPFLSGFVDPAGQITGSGIGTLVTIPGQPQAPAYLLAPNGDIDAGDAGIRASGNLFIVALAVLNASNISVGGKAVGIPTAPTISVSALNAANATSTAGSVANNLGAQNAPTAQQTPSIITVEVLGFGEVDAEPACVNASDPNCRGKGR